MDAPARDFGSKFVERRQVVEDPERPSLRGHDEILLLDGQVGDRHHRKIQLERLPARTVVEGDVKTRLRAGIEQSPPRRVFPDHAGERAARDPGVDLCPSLAVVRRLVEVRTEVIELVHRGGNVSGRLVVRRDVDRVDLDPLRNPPGGHVLPVPAAVACHMHEAVVGSRPDRPGLVR